MRLRESIKRILEEYTKQLKDMLVPANPKGKLHHYSSYQNRESIQKNGLIPKVGRQTTNYMSKQFPDVEPMPLIFTQDPKHGNFFGVYGNDIWEIDLSKVNAKWYHDPIHKDDGNNWAFYVTTDPIPPSAIKLIGSNEQRDDDMEVYRQTGKFPNRNVEPEEPKKPEEPDIWDELLSQIGDDDYITIPDEYLKESIKRTLKEITNPNTKRRHNQIRRLLIIILKNSITCGPDYEQYEKSVLDDVETFMNVLDIKGLSGREVKDHIEEYLMYFIKRYYTEAQEDC